MKQSLALVNAYSLLYPEAFAEKFGSHICTELNSSISELRAEGVTMVLRTVELMLRSSPTHGPLAVKPILGKVFQYVGIYFTMRCFWWVSEF